MFGDVYWSKNHIRLPFQSSFLENSNRKTQYRQKRHQERERCRFCQSGFWHSVNLHCEQNALGGSPHTKTAVVRKLLYRKFGYQLYNILQNIQ